MNRFTHIDAMRGLAALGVIYLHMARYLIDHASLAEWERGVFYILTSVIDIGKVSVIVFFAISGFVVPFSLFSNGRTPIRSFVISRFFRLYPAYWLSIPFGVLFFFIMQDRPVSAALIIENATMLQQFIGAENIIGLYWTLQIEMIFYALCVGLFAGGWLRGSRGAFVASMTAIAAALILAVLRFYLEQPLPVALPLSLAVMFWGFLCRRALLNEDPAAGRRAKVTFWLLAGAIPAISVLAYGRDLGHGETWYRYALTYYVAMALFVGGSTRLKIQNMLAAYIGKISYSVYLFGAIAEEIVLRLFPPFRTSMPAHAYIVLAMGLSIVMASMIYRIVEAPSIATGKLLSRWLDGGRSVSNTTEIDDVPGYSGSRESRRCSS